jgi:L-serine/L-threonine ammonia-lyase
MVGPHDAFIPPFDHPRIWTGHATVIDEIAQSGVRPDAIVVSVGGGGLLCGVVEGLHRNGMHTVPVIAVETEGAASLHASIQANKRVELPSITTIATSLGAKKVAERAFAYTHEHEIRSVVVSDAQAVSASLRFMDDHRIVVEPACGAALAAVYENHPALQGCKTVVCIACGGVTMTVQQLQAHAKQLC